MRGFGGIKQFNMCRVHTPGEVIRPLIIEVFNNGKVSIVPDIMQGNELTIDELTACRDLIDLIIANPKNFHIVKTEEPVIIINCRECRKPLGNNTELQTGICFSCEKNKLLSQPPVFANCANIHCLNFGMPFHTQEEIDSHVCDTRKPRQVKQAPIAIENTEELSDNKNEVAPVDDLDRACNTMPGYNIEAGAQVCGHPDCNKILTNQIAKDRGTCVPHRNYKAK